MQGYRYKDFMPMVWTVFILYLFGWVPGFLANLVALAIALFSDYDEQQGRGCLITLFLIVGCIPLITFFLVGLALLHMVMQQFSLPSPLP